MPEQATFDRFVPDRDDPLTDRQREMWEAVEIDGKAIREVARKKGLNPGTVCQHVQRANEKLDRGESA